MSTLLATYLSPLFAVVVATVVAPFAALVVVAVVLGLPHAVGPGS